VIQFATQAKNAELERPVKGETRNTRTKKWKTGPVDNSARTKTTQSRDLYLFTKKRDLNRQGRGEYGGTATKLLKKTRSAIRARGGSGELLSRNEKIVRRDKKKVCRGENNGKNGKKQNGYTEHLGENQPVDGPQTIVKKKTAERGGFPTTD